MVSIGWTCDAFDSIRSSISVGGLGTGCIKHSVPNFCLPVCCHKNFKIKMYRTVILPVVLYGCETWLLTLREEDRLRVFENMVLRIIFGRKRDEVTGNGENYIIQSLMIGAPHPILFG